MLIKSILKYQVFTTKLHGALQCSGEFSEPTTAPFVVVIESLIVTLDVQSPGKNKNGEGVSYRNFHWNSWSRQSKSVRALFPPPLHLTALPSHFTRLLIFPVLKDLRTTNLFVFLLYATKSVEFFLFSSYSWYNLSLIHIWRCRRSTLCRSRWSPYH